MNDELQFRPMSKGLGFHPPKDTSTSLKINASTNSNSPIKKAALIQQAALIQNKPKTATAINFSSPLKKATSLSKNSLINEHDPIISVKDSFVSSKSTTPSLLTRFSSWLIDIIALTILMSISSMLIFQLNNFSWDEPMQFFQMDFFWNLYLPLGLGFYLFYFMLFERVTGQTLGKLILGIKVVKLNSDTPPSLVQCFLRNFLNIISFATLGLLTVYDVVNWSLGLKVVKNKS